MPEIILSENNEEEQLKYEATVDDEEKFFLMYHMSMQPSEAAGLDPDYRKWLVARFFAQKATEQEMMERHRLLHKVMPNIQV